VADNGQKIDPVFLYEVSSVAVQGLLYPFGVKDRELEAVGPGRSRPVILIHGWGANRSCLYPLRWYLRSVGFDRVFGFNFGSSRSIEEIADLLKEFVDEIRKCCDSGKQTVDLVAHSLGGLAARVYLQELGGARHVDRCITIATPHYGTYSSYWTPTALGRQMRPESEFMARLNQPDQRAPGVRFTSLWADLDLMVLPRENAIYKEGEDIPVTGIGHAGILLHPKTMRQVSDRLRSGQDIPSTRLELAAQLAKGIISKSLSLLRSRQQIKNGSGSDR
jgi:triacylglycerol esterase/lipase EstA (alpha/beta hydrolase family)